MLNPFFLIQKQRKAGKEESIFRFIKVGKEESFFLGQRKNGFATLQLPH
jgi:hypothetical protein